jgi:hypothetical protein
MTAVSVSALAFRAKADGAFIQSARSGPWSSPATWEGNQVPPAGSKVAILPTHTLVYDRDSDQPIRMLHVTGTLTFSRDRNTRLDVGLLKIGGDSGRKSYSYFQNTASMSTSASSRSQISEIRVGGD